jgi:AsmA protein
VPGKPVEIDLSMGLGTGKIGIDSDLTLATVLEYDLDAQRYQLKPLDFGAKLKGKAIPGGAADVKLSTNAIEADLKNQNAAVSGLKLAGLGIDANGDIKAKDFMGGAPVLDGKLAVQVAQVSELLKLLGQEVKGASLGALNADVGFAGTGKKTSIQPFNLKLAVAGEQIPKGKTDIVLSTRGDIDAEAQRFALSDLSVQGLGLDLKGGLQVENLNKEPTFSGTIKLAPINLRAFLTDMGQTLPAMADPKTLNQFGLETKLSGTAKSASLSELALNLDDTHIKGNIAVADFAKPAIDFKLAVDGIDVDRYLPPKAAAATAKDKEAPKAAEKSKAATPGAAAAGAAEDLPVETLRALDVRGNLTVGKLKINNANLSNLNVNISAKNGDVKLSPLAANLYGGKYNGGVLIDARGKAPTLTLDENLSGINLDPLLTDLAGASKLTGTLDLQAQLNATGANADGIKRSLSGPAKITLRDGALKGVNLGMLARKAQAGVVMPVEEKVQTDFTEMTATLNFVQGVMSNEDLSMKSPLLRVEGAGKVNLVSEQIDYVLKTTLSATSKGQGGKETGELEGLTVPVKVSGTFAEPKYLPDLEGLARAKAEQLLEKESQKATEKLQEKLGDEVGKDVGDKLKGILKF